MAVSRWHCLEDLVLEENVKLMWDGPRDGDDCERMARVVTYSLLLQFVERLISRALTTLRAS